MSEQASDIVIFYRGEEKKDYTVCYCISFLFSVCHRQPAGGLSSIPLCWWTRSINTHVWLENGAVFWGNLPARLHFSKAKLKAHQNSPVLSSPVMQSSQTKHEFDSAVPAACCAHGLIPGKEVRPWFPWTDWPPPSPPPCCPPPTSPTSGGVLVGLAVLCLSGLIGLTWSLYMIPFHSRGSEPLHWNSFENFFCFLEAHFAPNVFTGWRSAAELNQSELCSGQPPPPFLRCTLLSEQKRCLSFMQFTKYWQMIAMEMD